jgi:threonine synthase
MYITKCPACGVKLGDFLYADACPHCQALLKHNLVKLTLPHVKVATAKAWPVRAFSSILRFVES